MHPWIKRAGLLMALALGVGLAGAGPAPERLTGKVVGVADGDTLTVLTPEKREVKVRLDQIDAPERGPAHGTRSRQSLNRMVRDRQVQVEVSGRDRYGRTVGTVRTGGTNVNAAMVQQGDAWAYRDYLRDPNLLRLEQNARSAKRGLWAQPAGQITSPWEYRSDQRTARPTARSACAKRTCSVMTSCAEARRHLRQCALPSLDADGDGTPCESLCKG